MARMFRCDRCNEEIREMVIKAWIPADFKDSLGREVSIQFRLLGKDETEQEKKYDLCPGCAGELKVFLSGKVKETQK